MRLERAGDGDIPAVVALMNLAFRGEGPGASWNTEADHIAGDRTSEALLRSEAAAKPDGVLLVSRGEGGEITASVWLEPLSGGVWYLGSLTVSPALQNGGFGRRMLEAAESWAAARGATAIRMTVVNVRETLIAWYLRRAYRLTGETEPFPYDDARFGTPKRDGLAFVVLERDLPATNAGA